MIDVLPTMAWKSPLTEAGFARICVGGGMKHALLMAVAAAILITADATGTWTGTLTKSDGQSHPAHLVLKQDGDKLTGTAGPDANEQHPIANGKAQNGVLTFELDNGMKFAVKQDGDEIAGEVTRDREGQTQKATLAVKRVK